MVAAAEAECEVVVRHMVLDSSALSATPCPHFFVTRHRFAAASCMEGLLSEEPQYRLPPLLPDVFPLRFVAKTPAVNTLTVVAPMNYKVAIIHIAILLSAYPFLYGSKHIIANRL